MANISTEIETEPEINNRVWCCAWGLIKQEHGLSSCNGDNNSKSKDEEPNSTSTPSLPTVMRNKKKQKTKEFVVTGGAESQLKIVHSPNEEKMFPPFEYTHQLPGSVGVHNVVVSPDSSTIAAVAMNGNLMVLDVNEGLRLPNICHTLVSNYWSATFADDDSEALYAGTGSGQVFKYDTGYGKLQHCYDTQRCENVLGLAVSKNQRLVGCSDYAGNFTLIDGTTGQVICRRNFMKTMRKLVFEPHARLAYVACDDMTVKIVDLTMGRNWECLMGHTAYIMSVSVSSDGRRLVSAACDGSIKIWDLRTTKSSLDFVSKTNTNLWDVAFNRLNNKIAFVGEGKGLNISYCLGNKEILLL